jgi:hypothetical protein
MPQRDIFHAIVVKALIKDGWIITNDPLRLAYGGRNLYADLGAEQPIGAEKGGRKIAVEIKSFIAESDVYDLELCIGQYRLYRAILARTEPDRSLHLAIPAYSYEGIFTEPIGRLAIEEEQLQLIVFDDEQGVITQWIP